MSNARKPPIMGIELFCGTKSFTKVAEKHGIRMITLDNDARFSPDICKDILDVGWISLPLKPMVLWASPPCQCFSVASISTHWKGGCGAYVPKTEACENSLRLIRMTIAIISHNYPIHWFIENPRGVLRKVIDVIFEDFHITDYKRETVTYCQYGDERMKPTDIWTNLKSWKPRPMCKNGDDCHVPAPRGAKTGTQGRLGSVERSRIPSALCKEIVEAILKSQK